MKSGKLIDIVIRILMASAGILVILAIIFSLSFGGIYISSLALIILTLFLYGLLAVKMIVCSIDFKFTKELFPYMYNNFGRGIYFIFLGSLIV